MAAVTSPVLVLPVLNSPYTASKSLQMSLDGSGYASVHETDEGSEGKHESSSRNDPTQNELEETNPHSSSIRAKTPPLSGLRIQTSYSHQNSGTGPDEQEPQSVIYDPRNARDFSKSPMQTTLNDGDHPQPPSADYEKEPSSGRPGAEDRVRLQSVATISANSRLQLGKNSASPSPSTQTASEPPADHAIDRVTPRPLSKYEFKESEKSPRMNSSNENAIAKSPFPNDKKTESASGLTSKEAEINALGNALDECWTLCNTLANLSYIHQERLSKSQNDDVQEDAWRSCWQLCQRLYNTRNDDYAAQISPTLDLCRDFCQALFDARHRDADASDSILRVSFELNNHLYNTHDRDLPDPFRERTLEFYITMCHRLMKQRIRITETDSLLSSCWSLTEILFSIRQSRRDKKPLDEKLLGSAVQACWELCDIFREGWKQHNIRSSDRETPRPSQITFTEAFYQVSQQQLELDDAWPATPTTIFDDAATANMSPDSPPGVLTDRHRHHPWQFEPPGLSRSSSRTDSSANTVTTISEDPSLMRLKILITKAAIMTGFQRGGTQHLSSFVKALSSDAFGSAQWQVSLLKNYKQAVASDPEAFRNNGTRARVDALDLAQACQSMVQGGQYSWLGDLYRFVMGFPLESSYKGLVVKT